MVVTLGGRKGDDVRMQRGGRTHLPLRFRRTGGYDDQRVRRLVCTGRLDLLLHGQVDALSSVRVDGRAAPGR